jgi:hypothetical protein
MLLLVAWPFLRQPGRLAPTRDPAWYTWRTNVLLHSHPSILFEKSGPFGMFSGGYRITTPLAGALLARVAGVQPVYFTALLAVALPLLTSMALAAFALRHRGDPLAYLLTLVAAVPLFLTIPFIGYMDNLMGLLFLAVGLWFLDGARTSWGARSALAILLFLATLTHPPATALFVVALGVVAAIRLIAARFALRPVIEAEGPMLASVAVGVVLALAFWKIGLWGGRTGLSDAVLTQPYSATFFRDRLRLWVRGMHLRMAFSLGILAIGWVGVQIFRRRPVDRHAALSVLWLLPLLGVFGFLLGLSYPYYRFINQTLAPMLLVGLGAWVFTRIASSAGQRVGDRWQLLHRASVGVALLAIGFSFIRPGLHTWQRQSPWSSRSQRVTFAAVRSYVADRPGRPVVFILHPNPRTARAWGFAKQASNAVFSGLAGDQIERTFLFVGDPGDFLARRPTVTGYPVFDRVSRGFLADMNAGLDRFPAGPAVLYVEALNPSGTPPEQGSTAPIAPGVDLLLGPGLDPPQRAAAVDADRAEQSMDRRLAVHQGLLGDPANILRAAAGIALLLLPGIIAMRWFELRDFPTRMALVPGTSLALVMMAGILVVAVTRSSLGSIEAWATVGLAIAAASGLALGAGRRRALPPGQRAATDGPIAHTSDPG